MEMTNFNSNGVDLTLRSPFPACHGTKKNSSLSQEALKCRTLQCVFVERKCGDFPQYLIQKPSLNVLFEHRFPSLCSWQTLPLSPQPQGSQCQASPPSSFFLSLPSGDGLLPATSPHHTLSLSKLGLSELLSALLMWFSLYSFNLQDFSTLALLTVWAA